MPAAAAAASRRLSVCAASAAPAGGPGDLGDEFEEMVERRDELLRMQSDAELSLNSDEDEELADLTDRLLKFGYLEATELDEDEEVAAVLVGGDEETTDEEDGAALYASEEDTDTEESEEEEAAEVEVLGEDVVASSGEAAPRRNTGGRGNRLPPEDVGIDDIVSEAQRGGTQDLRNMGMFEVSSPGVSANGGVYEEGEEEEEAVMRYPEPPLRSYRLAELLRLAGLDVEAVGAPELEVADRKSVV